MFGAVIATLMAASIFMPWVEFFGESHGLQVFFDNGLQALGVRAQVHDLGFPLPRMEDFGGVLNGAREVMSIGVPAYFVSAALLVLIGLVRLIRGT